MHILSDLRQAIELDLIASSFVPTPGVTLLTAASETASPFVNDAARAFFGMGLQRPMARELEQPTGPPPTVFRERLSGLLRMAYREAVIRFKRGVPERTRRKIIDKYGYKVRKTNAFIPDQVVIYQPEKKHVGAEMLERTNDWAAMDEVVFATPNFVSQYRRQARHWIHPQQWHLQNRGQSGQLAGEDVKARDAWKITRGRRSIVVAVLDDGLDVYHPNLRRNIRRRPDPGEPRDLCGVDFFVPDDHPEHFNPRPKKFQFPYNEMTGNDIHGTPCAGVIAAAGCDRGATGVAPQSRILPVKIFHADLLASDARVADAIRYAAVHADILSCSWSGGHSPDIELALEDAGVLGRDGKGSAVFCATGNESANQIGFPASAAQAIAVGASTDRGRRANYSNTGPEVWVVAPSSGGIRGIFTTDVSIPNRGFNIGDANAGGADGLHTNDFGGTSSATPLAAGVAALALSVKPGLDRDAVREILKDTADKIGTGYDANGHSNEFGYGRVNAAKAVEQAAGI